MTTTTDIRPASPRMQKYLRSLAAELHPGTEAHVEKVIGMGFERVRAALKSLEAEKAAQAKPAPAKPAIAMTEMFGQALRRHDANNAAQLAWEGFGPDDPYSGANQAKAAKAKPTMARKPRRDDFYEGNLAGPCRRCGATGQFITYVENDVPKGPGGICYECAGKGHQTDCGEEAHAERAQHIADGVRDTTACCDRVRNDLFWRYGFKISL